MTLAVVAAAVVVLVLGWRASIVAVAWIEASKERAVAREEAIVGVGSAVAEAVGSAVESLGVVLAPAPVGQPAPAPTVADGTWEELSREAGEVIGDWTDTLIPQEGISRVVGEFLPDPPEEGW